MGVRLKNGFTAEQIAGCISSRRLDLTIFPTEKCNFRCTYCYEDFKTGRMQPHIVQGVKSLISTRADEIECLNISWFGGEPLIAKMVILEIAAHAFRLSQEYGFQFSGGLTTNAYTLTTDLIDKLVSLNQNTFQITLDGWGAGHDETRRRADGKGTFSVIWASLVNAQQTNLDFKFTLRIHLTHKNQDNLQRLCFELGRQFNGDQRFGVNYQDVRNLGGDGAKRVVGIEATSFKERINLLQQFKEHGESGEPFQSIKLKDNSETNQYKKPTGDSASGRRAYQIKQGQPYICYAAKPNHLLIRADGKVGKCTVALRDDRNVLGFIKPDGTIEIDQNLAREWSGGFANLDVDQLGCPLNFIPPKSRDNSQVSVILP